MQSLYIRLPWLERKLASRCQAIYEETPPLLVTFLKSASLIILSQEEYLKIFSAPAVAMKEDGVVLSEKSQKYDFSPFSLAKDKPDVK